MGASKLERVCEKPPLTPNFIPFALSLAITHKTGVSDSQLRGVNDLCFSTCNSDGLSEVTLYSKKFQPAHEILVLIA